MGYELMVDGVCVIFFDGFKLEEGVFFVGGEGIYLGVVK